MIRSHMSAPSELRRAVEVEVEGDGAARMSGHRQPRADRQLLATIGSWGDTLADEEVLAELREWNAKAAAEAR